ncbi:MAG: molybdopterin-dependent oxidoreductase, partial [Thermodesulfovibrionales bacterium]
MEFSRRTFLKFAMVGGAVTAAEDGIRKAGRLVPYVIHPEKLPPVVWHTIATTCRECPAGCGMHVRHKDGRITKAEGNPVHPVNRGGLCPRGQSALQGVYDPDRVREVRYRAPGSRLRPSNWKEALERIGKNLAEGEGRVAIMSRLETGMLAEIMSRFLRAFGSERLLFFEPFPYGPLREAHARLFGTESIPFYRLEQCDYLISFGADFLETWVSNVQFAADFGELRALRDGKVGRFTYVGPRLSMTACNADDFIQTSPGGERDIALALLKIMYDENRIRNGRSVVGSLVGKFDVRTVV